MYLKKKNCMSGQGGWLFFNRKGDSLVAYSWGGLFKEQQFLEKHACMAYLLVHVNERRHLKATVCKEPPNSINELIQWIYYCQEIKGS